jgi:sugar fermentation stimulation protein A
MPTSEKPHKNPNKKTGSSRSLTSWCYPYPPLQAGILVRRYKRFFADIELETGELITAHCPNTGPMTCISTPGSRVWVSVSDNPKRKLAYTWELIEVNETTPTWVGVNTAIPNRVIKQALQDHLFGALEPYDQIDAEVTYGQERSRIDFVVRNGQDPAQPPTYIEVKSTTWAQGHLALFPDTVTTRGQKHLRELQTLLPDHRAVMLYFINRSDCTQFAPGDSADPNYGQLLRQAVAEGVEVLPCRFEVSPEGIRFLGMADLCL